MRRVKPVFFLLICILFMATMPLAADMHSDYTVILQTLLDNLNFLRDGIKPEMNDHDLIIHLEEYLEAMSLLDEMTRTMREKYPEAAEIGKKDMTPEEKKLQAQIVDFYVNINPLLEMLAVHADTNPAISEYMNKIMGF